MDHRALISGKGFMHRVLDCLLLACYQTNNDIFIIHEHSRSAEGYIKHADRSHTAKHETLTQCWFNIGPTVYDAGPTTNQHSFDVSC